MGTIRYFTYPEGPLYVNNVSLSSDVAKLMIGGKKINSDLLFSENTQYESDAAKNNHFNDSLEKKITMRSVLKMLFSPGATRATMKSIDRSATETTAVAAITEALWDP